LIDIGLTGNKFTVADPSGSAGKFNAGGDSYAAHQIDLTGSFKSYPIDREGGGRLQGCKRILVMVFPTQSFLSEKSTVTSVQSFIL